MLRRWPVDANETSAQASEPLAQGQGRKIPCHHIGASRETSVDIARQKARGFPAVLFFSGLVGLRWSARPRWRSLHRLDSYSITVRAGGVTDAIPAAADRCRREREPEPSGLGALGIELKLDRIHRQPPSGR